MISVQKELDEKLELGENVSNLHLLFLNYFEQINESIPEDILEKPRRIRFCGMDLKGVLRFTVGILKNEQKSLNLLEAYFSSNIDEALLKSYQLIKTII